MSVAAEKKVRVLVMGEEIDLDALPASEKATDLSDYFAEVEISPNALDVASRIVGQKYFAEEGLYSFLKKRAQYVFSKMSGSQTGGRFRGLDYFFEYNDRGPVLKTVKLAQD